MRKFIDLKCDFGFKYCMQDEEIMKSFLNAILEGETDRITSVRFENVESPSPGRDQRGVNFDLLCTTVKGEIILIEMQNAPQKFFRTRAAFYVSTILAKQFTRGFKWEEMKEDISRIFGIFIMGENNNWLNKAITRTSVFDRDELVEFWDRNHNFFLSLPDFKLNKKNITTKDIWLYLFKDLGTMDRIDPSVYERADEGLLKLLEKANVAALTEEEYKQYEASMKRLEDEVDMEKHGFRRGLEQGLEQGRKEGREQGREEGEHLRSLKIAKELIQDGMPIEKIAQITQLTVEDVKGVME